MSTNITVVKRDGTRAEYDGYEIARSIEEAAAGLDDEVARATQLRSELEITLFDGITSEQLDEAVIGVALGNVKDDPAYDTIASRLLVDLTGQDAQAVADGLAWIAVQQDATGGFPGAAGISTNSTGLAIQAMSLAGTTYADQIAAAQEFLAAEQNPDGGLNVAAATPGSDVRATTQSLNGALVTSYGALTYPLPASPASGGGGSSGGSAPSPATSPVTTALTIRVNHSKVKPRALLKVTGRLTPAVAGQVRLQLRSKNKWKTLKVAALTTGRYVFKLRRSSSGSIRLRVVYPGATGYRPAASTTVKIRIRR